MTSRSWYRLFGHTQVTEGLLVGWIDAKQGHELLLAKVQFVLPTSFEDAVVVDVDVDVDVVVVVVVVVDRRSSSSVFRRLSPTS